MDYVIGSFDIIKSEELDRERTLALKLNYVTRINNVPDSFGAIFSWFCECPYQRLHYIELMIPHDVCQARVFGGNGGDDDHDEMIVIAFADEEKLKAYFESEQSKPPLPPSYNTDHRVVPISFVDLH